MKPSPAWQSLVEAVGSVAAVCESLDIAQTTLYRASRGMARFPHEKEEALEILCELYDVANPLESQGPPVAKDLSPLRMMGDAMAKGFPPAARTVERLRKMYPEDQLLQLAESDGTPEEILRAVTKLLE